MSHKPETTIIHAGREPAKNSGAVNPPVHHASTIIFETHADFVSAESGTFPGSVYGRHGTTGHRLLEDALANLEGADKCLLTPSGLAAITISLTSLLAPGDHLLMVDAAYGPARGFCEQELKRLGIEVEYYDPLIGSGISRLIRENTKVIYMESPGSLTFEVQDVPAITKAAKAAGVVTVLDNTWATPLFFKPFQHGVDVSIHSATKYIGGHSDLIMGIITCTEKLFTPIKRSYRNFGMSVAPDDVYLVQRGLRTMAARVMHQQEAALQIARWLKNRPEVSRVLHPALPDCPGHELWRRDFTGSTGLFSFILKKHLPDTQMATFVESMKLFKMGYSWGGYESLIIPLHAAKNRTAVKWEPEGSGFRIFIGLEHIDDLETDLDGAFAAIA